MFCTKCGTRVEQGARFCPTCGAPIVYAGQPQQPTDFDPISNDNPTVYGPPPAPIPGPRRSNKALIIVLVVVIVALVLGLLYLLGNRNKAEAPANEPAAIEQPAAPEPKPTPAPAPNDAKDEAIKNAIAEGYQVFEGELRIMSNEELAEAQGMDASMFSTEGTFAVLFFNHETTIDGMSADGSGQRTENATMLGVAEYTDYDYFVVDEGDLDSWRSYDGKTVTVAVRAEDVWFPSDVSLPVGEPRTGEARILE